MKALIVTSFSLTCVVIAGFLVVLCIAMPQELDQETSNLIGGFTPWCPCFGNDATIPCASKPGKTCSGYERYCVQSGEDDPKGTCYSSGTVCDNKENCDYTTTPLYVYCSQTPG